MPVCAFACRYAATYISCSQAEAVNTKRRLLHSYETHPATLFPLEISHGINQFVAFTPYCSVFRFCFRLVFMANQPKEFEKGGMKNWVSPSMMRLGRTHFMLLLCLKSHAADFTKQISGLPPFEP